MWERVLRLLEPMVFVIAIVVPLMTNIHFIGTPQQLHVGDGGLLEFIQHRGPEKPVGGQLPQRRRDLRYERQRGGVDRHARLPRRLVRRVAALAAAEALFGGGRAKKSGGANNAVRLHLSFHLLDDKPVSAQRTIFLNAGGL